MDQAIAENAPWLEEIGQTDLVNSEEWRRKAVTVACFRDLYGVNGDSALGQEHAAAKNRERDRQLALVVFSAMTAQTCATSAKETSTEEPGLTATSKY